MGLGERLQEARKRLNITQEQLADQLEVTRQSISRWELNIVYPDMQNLIKLSNLLEVSLDYLLKDDNYEKPKNISPLLQALVGKEVHIEFDNLQDYVFFSSRKRVIILEVTKDWLKLESTDKKTKEVECKLVPVDSVKAITCKEAV